MIDAHIQRAREEQVKLVALLQSGHPDRRGIELAICDWFWEEMLVQRELEQRRQSTDRPTLYDTSGGGALDWVSRSGARPGSAVAAQRVPIVARKPPFLAASQAVKKPPASAWRQEP